MKTFRITPRGKKYWIEEIDATGRVRVLISFSTEEAATRCLRDYREREAARLEVEAGGQSASQAGSD